MAIVLASGGSVSAAGGTLSEATAALRYIRATICNADTIQHTYHVQVGAQFVKRSLTLAANEDRTVGPFSLTAAETMIVTQVEAATTSGTWIRFVGES